VIRLSNRLRRTTHLLRDGFFNQKIVKYVTKYPHHPETEDGPIMVNGKQAEPEKEPALQKDDPRFKLVEQTLKRTQRRQDALIEVLHTAQEAYGYLEKAMMIYVAQELKLPLSWVYGVATFYHFFSLEPQGEHTCIICMGTACYVKGAGAILSRLEQEFGIKAGETTPDGTLSLLTARCLGSCGLAPVMILDGRVLGRETPDSMVEKVRALVGGAPVPASQAAGEAGG
jgi:bidirectional [NiFe] hydrogenase diaphorase subunit